MTTTKRAASALALGAAIALLASGCAGRAAPGGLDNVQTITWWHNSTQTAAKDYYDKVANDFERDHPGVNVEVTALEHSDMLARLDATLESDDPEQVPDVFMSRGGGELEGEVAAGVTRDLTKVAAEELAKISRFTNDYTVDGKVYALPYSMGIVGFYYNTDLFEQAGITEVNPSPTIDEFNGWIDQLQAAGIPPISVGAGDKWPAAHYWFYNVVRECTYDTVEAAIASKSYADPCFLRAGESLSALVAKQPFNEGYATTAAQEGPTSASGLLANGQVAMELAGHWEPGLVGGLRADGTVPDTLSWFAYPTFPGQAGDPLDQMGGGDAWEVSTSAPDVAVDLAKYLLSDEVQKGFAELNMGLPTNPAAADSIAFPALQDLVAVRDKASRAPQLYLDTRLGSKIGDPLVAEIYKVFTGESGAQQVVDAINAAANGSTE
ncbi:extracellular solute-binding protein family 1 [Xylanimonas cellulosilytica DSM 15894]|uniref:Extracellular solute-binding protein family 1 n=1 Tax=Xylanimonas cellulosilytica (strain DSM 15894 / JCM 12276 / CECT 5975 / KCTC 9989 / LMG 20990 / NBRC 107835 / XIL07) TaxID=446471 RepID=D1BUI3_XYLCX|nr:extracellular solute-binding protein [Xylanimonas cellulosilytica]ACZ29224.1 extracellular solute-binding protein family 1 [Xylanimonas cellulosilytica DSM 15894]